MKTAILSFVILLMPLAARSDPKVTRCAGQTESSTKADGALKDTITICVPGVNKYLTDHKLVNPQFVLYLRGVAFTGLAISTPSPSHESLQFYLDRSLDNRDQWNNLFRSPFIDAKDGVRRMSLTVGIEKGDIFDSDFNDFGMRIYEPWILWLCGGLFVILVGLFLWAANQSDVLRESGAPPPANANGLVPRRAFSLARVQMAVWFFVVIASFVLIWIITSGLDAILPSVLALIGISSGTGLAAVVVDTGKSSSSKGQRDQLVAEDNGLKSTLVALAAKPQPLSPDDTQKEQAALNRRADIQNEIADIDEQLATPAHDTFVTDILSDANGISFHRFQMATWTFVLALIFIVSVCRDLVMPDFNATLLGLMGLSSGTYIGFKLPEVKN